jgi:hypothetical protein
MFRKWLTVTRVIHAASRVEEEPLSAVRLGHGDRVACEGLLASRTLQTHSTHSLAQCRPAGQHTKIIPASKSGEQLLDIQFAPAKRSSERNVIDIGLHVAARSPVIDGPCGCHPP